jgi:hypothetical protein
MNVHGKRVGRNSGQFCGFLRERFCWIKRSSMHDARIYTLIDLTNWNDRAGSAITGQCGVQLANHHWGQRHSLVCYVGHVHANWRLTSISCFLLLGSAKLASLHRICCWHTDTAQRIYSSIALPIYWNYLVCTVRTADSINSHDDNAQVRSSWDKLRTAAGSSCTSFPQARTVWLAPGSY